MRPVPYREELGFKLLYFAMFNGHFFAQIFGAETSSKPWVHIVHRNAFCVAKHGCRETLLTWAAF